MPQGLALPTLLFPRSGFTFAAWVRVGRMPPEVMPVSPLVTGAPPPAPVHQPHLYSFCNAQGQGFVAYFENAQGELHLILETRGPQGKHDRFEAVRAQRTLRPGRSAASLTGPDL